MIDVFKYVIPSFFNHGNLSVLRLISYVKALSVLSNCNLVFVSSVGREGSGYISGLVKVDSEVEAYHERRPFCNGRELIGLAGRYDRIYKRKVIEIAHQVLISGATGYVESNHMFGKTFGRFLLSSTDLDFKVVVIKSPVLRTVQSFYQLDWFSDRYERARNWVYKVSDGPDARFKKWGVSCEIHEIVAYFIAEKIREREFISECISKGHVVSEVSVPCSKENLCALSLLGIPVDDDFVSGRANSRNDVKTKSGLNRTILLQEIINFTNLNRDVVDGVDMHVEDGFLIVNGERWAL